VPGASIRPERLLFIAVSIGNDVCSGDVLEDVHFQVQLGCPVLLVLPEGPEHPGERWQQGAVHRLDLLLNLFEVSFFFVGKRLAGKFFENRVEEFGVKDLRLGQRSQAGFFDSKTFLDFSRLVACWIPRRLVSTGVKK